MWPNDQAVLCLFTVYDLLVEVVVWTRLVLHCSIILICDLETVSCVCKAISYCR